MIGRLVGKIIEKNPPALLVDVGGVGYELQAPMTTFYDLPEVGEQTTLYTHFVVREDAQSLYAFLNSQDRLLFRTIIKVSGVGPKIGLAILSGISAQGFVHCIKAGDTATLVRLPGVGKKMAERLVVELRSRLKDWQVSVSSPAGQALPGGVANGLTTTAMGFSVAANDALNGLLALGYKLAHAERAIAAIKDKATTSEELIRLALQQITEHA